LLLKRGEWPAPMMGRKIGAAECFWRRGPGLRQSHCNAPRRS
jgi:hypothetical protein